MAKGQSGLKLVDGKRKCHVKRRASSFNLKGQSRAIPVGRQFSGDTDIIYIKNHSNICTFKKQKSELQNVTQAKFITAKLILPSLQDKIFIAPIQVMNISEDKKNNLKIHEMIAVPITPHVSNSLTTTTS